MKTFHKLKLNMFRRKKKEEANIDSPSRIRPASQIIPSVSSTRPIPSSSAMENDLPVEVKHHIASFLLVRDLLKLSKASKCMRQDLGIVTISASLTNNHPAPSRTFETNGVARCFAAVIPNIPDNQSSHHSLTTTFVFNVGHRRSGEYRIWIEEQDLPGVAQQTHEHLKSMCQRVGKPVAKIKSKRGGRLYLSFQPKPRKFYQYWVVTYHLELSNMMLHHVGMGTSRPSRHTAYEFTVPKPFNH